MVEIKRNENWEITNYDELLEWLSRNIRVIYQKEDYYYEKYKNRAGKELAKKFGTYSKYINSIKSSIFSRFLETRESIVDGNKVTYIIVANNTFFVNVHILISCGNDYISLVHVHKNSNIHTTCVEMEDSLVLPVIIDSHFCTRFLEYNTFSENWKYKMMEELGLCYNLPCMTSKGVEDNFVYPTNKEIITAERGIKDLNIDVKEDFDKFDEFLTKSCLYGTINSKDGYIMIPPRKGEFFLVKTYIKRNNLRPNQLDIIRYQHAATGVWLEDYFLEKKKEGF